MRDKDQFFRRVSILQRIPMAGRGKCGVSQLRTYLAQLGYRTTERTIQRDLQWLSGHFPITSDEGHPAGWNWIAGAPGLQVPHLDPLTALAVLLSHQVLRPLLPATLLENWEHYRRAAESALSESPFANWQRHVLVLSSQIQQKAPELAFPLLSRILEALEKHRQIQVLYRRPNRNPREHTLSPWGIVLHNGAIYLVARSRGGKVGIFATQRISKIRVLEDEGTPMPTDFSLEAFARASLSFAQPGQIIRLRFQVDQDLLYLVEERPLGSGQRILQRGRRWVTVETEIEDSLALEWWILSFGANLRVLEPESLRVRLRETIGEMAALYRRKPNQREEERADAE